MVHYQSEFPTADGQCTKIYFGDEVVGCSLYSFFRPLSGYPSLPISAPKISNYEPAGDDDSDGDDDHETRLFGS